MTTVRLQALHWAPAVDYVGCEARRRTCSERENRTEELCEIKWDYHIDGTTVPRQNVRRQNVRRLNIRGQNVRRDKTSVGTKRPWGQNIRSDKTSIGQNVRGDKTSGGQNIHGDKTSVGTKRPSRTYLQGPCEAIFLT